MVFPTIGTITQELEKSLGRRVEPNEVAYAIRRLRVQPIGRAGIVRLFPESAVTAVKRFLETKRGRGDATGGQRQPVAAEA